MMQANLSTIVTYNPWALDGDSTIGDLVDLVNVADFNHWPIIDADRQLIGMLSRSELVRIFEAVATAISISEDSRDERIRAFRSRPVSEFMSPRVVSIQQNESPAVALWTLLDQRIHALPVLTDTYLTALATTSDFLREFSYGESLASCIAVNETMQPPNEAVDCDATLDEVAMAMHFAQTDAIPIVRGDLPLGVVSRRDLGTLKLSQTLCNVFGTDVSCANCSSILALAASAPTIRPGERLSAAASLMVEHHRQAIAVVNQAGRLLGVVTEELILRTMLDSMK